LSSIPPHVVKALKVVANFHRDSGDGFNVFSNPNSGINIYVGHDPEIIASIDSVLKPARDGECNRCGGLMVHVFGDVRQALICPVCDVESMPPENDVMPAQQKPL
jgi:hypothetical protein